MMNQEEQKKIELAIQFLVIAMQQSGHTTKPVVFHSMRVGVHLYNLQYPTNIIIGGILHDVLEDTATQISDIEHKFGHHIAALVSANSFDTSIIDKTAQYIDMFSRCKTVGKEALIIKVVDLFDNADYYQLAEHLKQKKWLLEKLRYFIELSHDELQHEVLYTNLKHTYETIRPSLI
jgi:(p)ppGpp synthase/HD superfamily hydrolase